MKTVFVLMIGLLFLASCEQAPQEEVTTPQTEEVSQDSTATETPSVDSTSIQPVQE